VNQPEVDPEFEDLLLYLKESRGFDFSGYKRASLVRRVRRRMETLHIERFADYQDYLQVDQDEFAYLFDVILINVTAFFRDPPIWEYVAESVIPTLLSQKGEDEQVRAWCAGAASGEEAYTAAMLLAEALGREQFLRRVKIYATDVDEDALRRGRSATYSAKDVEPVPPALLDRYFDVVNSSYVFDKELRRGVIFGRHDLVQDAPISKIDLLVCRNTLMYFNAETQATVVSRLQFALNDGAFLVLGKAEMMFSSSRSFEPVDLKCRVFMKRRSADVALAEPPEAAADLGVDAAERARARDAALEAGPVAQVVVDEAGVLVSANRRARDLFGLVPSDTGRPFRDLDLSYRPLELRSLMDQARDEGRVVLVREVPWGRGPETRYFDVEAVGLFDAAGERAGVSISFTDVSRDYALRVELERANQELETAMEELQSTNEELETTNEELQSTNEELETTNEELQATNEELETTNEELQATNEELETMNEELQSTNEELSAVNEEMRQQAGQLDELNALFESVMQNVDAAVVVLDRQLQVLMWNRQAEDLWGLRGEEVTGRPLLDLDIGLPVAELSSAMRGALEDAEGTAEMAVEATNRRGHAIRCRVNLSSLRGPDGVSRGVIMLMEATPRGADAPA